MDRKCRCCSNYITLDYKTTGNTRFKDFAASKSTKSSKSIKSAISGSTKSAISGSTKSTLAVKTSVPTISLKSKLTQIPLTPASASDLTTEAQVLSAMHRAIQPAKKQAKVKVKEESLFENAKVSLFEFNGGYEKINTVETVTLKKYQTFKHVLQFHGSPLDNENEILLGNNISINRENNRIKFTIQLHKPKVIFALRFKRDETAAENILIQTLGEYGIKIKEEIEDNEKDAEDNEEDIARMLQKIDNEQLQFKEPQSEGPLYNNTVVLQFYGLSSDKPPGKGTGEKMPPESASKYAELAKIKDWRKMLSNDWSDDTQRFTIEGKQWSSVKDYLKFDKSEDALKKSLMAKFAQVPELLNVLLLTNDALLINYIIRKQPTHATTLMEVRRMLNRTVP